MTKETARENEEVRRSKGIFGYIKKEVISSPGKEITFIWWIYI